MRRFASGAVLPPWPFVDPAASQGPVMQCADSEAGAQARNAKDAPLARPFALAANAKALDNTLIARLIAAFYII